MCLRHLSCALVPLLGLAHSTFLIVGSEHVIGRATGAFSDPEMPPCSTTVSSRQTKYGRWNFGSAAALVCAVQHPKQLQSASQVAVERN